MIDHLVGGMECRIPRTDAHVPPHRTATQRTKLSKVKWGGDGCRSYNEGWKNGVRRWLSPTEALKQPQTIARNKSHGGERRGCFRFLYFSV